MKILIHSDDYYPSCIAGAYRVKVFADEFMKNGNEVTVITSSANKNSKGTEGCKERILYAPTIKMKKKTTLMRMLNNLSFAFTSVFTALGAGKVDVVITTSPPVLISMSGWLIARLKGAKLVYDVRDIWPDVALEMNSFSEGSVFCKIFRCITNFMYKHADMVTTVSPGKVTKIKDKLPENMRDKVELVGNGFDEKVLDSTLDDDVVKQYDLENKFTCVYIGNIGLAQGLGALLDLAAKTEDKNIQFLLFGKGAEKDLLEQRVKDENLTNVKLCGVIDHSKVFSVLSKSQISFIPLKSSKMKDSVPTKMYEALGIGCPVLLVAEGDACDILNEAGMGRCMSPDNLESLQDVFNDIVENYQEISGNAEKSARLMKEKHSRQKIAAEFEKKLREFVK